MASKRLPDNLTKTRFLGPTELGKLRPLWEALYREQAAMGMRLPVAHDGFLKWEQQMRTTLDRFSRVAVAELDREFAGFVAAKLRLLPAEYGGDPVGFVSEVYVCEAFRGRGLAKTMLNCIVSWFRTQGIRRIELQVIAGNLNAKKMYTSLGWKDELTQMVYAIPDSNTASE